MVRRPPSAYKGFMAIGKKWYQSSTLWFNIGQFALGILLEAENFMRTGDYSPLGFVVLLSALINFALRFRTQEPIV